MAKVAIKNENITSFGGIYHIMGVFSKLGFEKLTIRNISEKVKPLKKTSRLKAFILHFVSVPAKWVRTGRQNVLNLYTNKTYYAEIFIE